MKRYLDKASALTLALTLVLFVVALFVKGLTHDLLLEAGVLLVSIKLVLAGYKNEQGTRLLLDRLDRVDHKLGQLTDPESADRVPPQKS